MYFLWICASICEKDFKVALEDGNIIHHVRYTAGVTNMGVLHGPILVLFEDHHKGGCHFMCDLGQAKSILSPCGGLTQAERCCVGAQAQA